MVSVGRVIKKREEPRSYVVRLPNGDIVRRNRHHLRDCMGKKVRFNDTADKHVDTRLEERRKDFKDINRRDTGPVNNSPVTANTTRSTNTTQESESQLRPYITRSGRLVTKPNRLLENCE